jgi:hypothetical protein
MAIGRETGNNDGGCPNILRLFAGVWRCFGRLAWDFGAFPSRPPTGYAAAILSALLIYLRYRNETSGRKACKVLPKFLG